MDATTKKRRSPAKTAQGRELQLINLSYDLAEKQLAAGTASSQVMTHFLKLGSERAKLEAEKIKRENLLLEAKVKAIESAQKIEELYKDAISAFRSYQGIESEDEILDDV